MVVIRPITPEDLDAIEHLATLTGFGMTTLPRDVKMLRKRIRESVRGFEKLTDEDPPRGETYLFVLEDLDTKQILGVSGVVSKVGGFEPFYAYRIEHTVHESKQLKIRKEVRTLHLVVEHDGPCEIGSLFLAPDHRQGGNGRLLSLSRFLFMAEFPEYFDPMIIAEMRGVMDDEGHAPFWDAVGKHFFEIDFPTADYLSMVDKRFIADLMPRHPIYITLLCDEAQAVIGQVHEQTRPALKLLQEEGFKFDGQVDIFEAGPVVRCPLGDIRTVRENIKEVVAEISADSVAGDAFHICNTRHDFRVCRAPLAITAAGVRISADVAAALRVGVGDSVRYATPHAAHPVPHAATDALIEESDVSLY